MTLLFMDSFDHHGTTQSSGGTTVQRKWGEASLTIESIVNGRFDYAKGYRMTHTGNSLLTPRFADGTELICGMAIRQFGSTSTFCGFRDSGTNQVQFYFDGGSVLHARLFNLTQPSLVSGRTNFKTDQWYYLELRVLVSQTVGEIEAHINGMQEFLVTGIDTQYTANTNMNEIYFNGLSGTNVDFDDIYVIDTNGSTNNDFLGERKVEAMFTDGAGANTDWAPSAGANWENVDDNPADDDTTYNSTDTTSDTDTFTYVNLGAVAQDISGVQINVLQRKEDVGARGLAAITVSGATTDVGDTKFVTDEYTYNLEILETDPNTAAQWTTTNLNAAEFGYRLIS